MSTKTHRFRFFRAGGFDQVLLDRADDLLALEHLDPKLWAALSCPVQGLEFDEKTLRLIDSDNDGRIRVPEVRAAVKWATSVLRDAAQLVQGGDSLALASIDAEHPEGKRILASARQILSELGTPDAEAITLAEVTDTAKLYAQMKFNGDGVVPPDSAADETTAAAIRTIIDCMGGADDRSGKPGVDKARVDAFFEAAATFDAWWKQAEAEADAVLPLGEATAEAARVLGDVRAKVDDWFTRCRLAAFDARSQGALNRSEAEYAAVAASMLSPTGEEVASFPLAHVVPNGALPLADGINPAWADRIAALHDKVIVPLLGARTALTADEWRQLVARLAPFEKWSANGNGSPVQKLGIQRIRDLLASGVRAGIDALVERDRALEQEVSGIALVERLVRYQRDLYRLLCNFVSFGDFYAKRKAVFQAGTLYLDRRSADLCMRVENAAAHATIASLGNTYLAYCDCTRKSDGKKMTIVAAITGGDSGGLMVGRNGIFYDRQGADWDATVVKIVEQPISVREAFWLPYRRVGKLIGDQVEKFASARDKEVHDRAATNIESTAKQVEAKPPVDPAAAPTPKEQAFDVAKFAGVFAAIGLAIGAIGSTLAAVTAGFLELRWWQMPLAVLGVMLLVSGPSMAIAALKLRRRSLGPILDASGWAVNSAAKINLRFGASLTSLATIPANAQRYLHDPYAPPRYRYATAAALLLVLVGLCIFAYWGGYTDQWLSTAVE